MNKWTNILRAHSPSGFYYESDNKSGSGAPPSGEGTTNGERAGEQKPEGNSAAKEENTITLTKAELQKQFDALASKVRAEEKEKQDKKALERSGEYEKLYSSLTAEHEAAKSELLSVKEQLAEHAKTVNASINEQIKHFPDEVKALDPGESDIKQRLVWIEKAKKIVDKLSGTRTVDGEHNPKKITPGSTKSPVDISLEKSFGSHLFPNKK